jgi:hypothetical protein
MPATLAYRPTGAIDIYPIVIYPNRGGGSPRIQI